MSDYFDTQLREGTAQVAGSLTTRTAAAVREHSERRARRLGAGTAALAASAVLVIGGTVFGLERQGGGPTAAVGVSHSTTASPSASPARIGSVAGTASAPNPSQYVAGAWLSESHLPYAGAIGWQVNPQVLGTELERPVQLVPPASAYFDNSVGGFGAYCSIPALADQAVANQQESFYGPITGSSVPGYPGVPATAKQSTVFYGSQSGAAAAWRSIGSGFTACAEFETGRVSAETKTYPSTGTVRQIVNESTVQCWTNLAAVSDLEPGVTDFLDNVCFVRHGTLISSVDLGFEGPTALSDLDFGAVDATVVSGLQHAVNAYGGD